MYCPYEGCYEHITLTISKGYPDTRWEPGEPAMLESIAGKCEHVGILNDMLATMDPKDFDETWQGGALLEAASDIERERESERWDYYRD